MIVTRQQVDLIHDHDGDLDCVLLHEDGSISIESVPEESVADLMDRDGWPRYVARVSAVVGLCKRFDDPEVALANLDHLVQATVAREEEISR